MTRTKTDISKQAHESVLRMSEGHIVLALVVLAVATAAVLFFAVPAYTGVVYDRSAPQTEKDEGFITVDASSTEEVLPATTTTTSVYDYPNYVPVPEAVRSIYMSQCVVGTPSFRNDLVELVEETELNSIIIDIKDYTGMIAFDTDNPVLTDSVSNQCGARDMKEFIATLHEKGIYVIGRITVFQDPFYSARYPELAVKFAEPAGSVWKDHKGLSFIDVGAKPFWNYIIELSLESHKLGFDELNYDYVRFPSDGPMKNISFDWAGNKAKAIALEEFFQYLHKEIKDPSKYPVGIEPPVISADLFGMVTTNYDDLNIGQVLERALPYFDYIAPMIYPSHYPDGFNGWQDPNTVPYELIKFVLDSAVERTEATDTSIAWFGSEAIYETVIVPPVGTTTPTTTKQVATGRYTKPAYDKDKIRPWLQDFDYGGDYDVAEVKAQIQATYDAGLDSWMLWAPSNRYTRGALESAE
jgi:hypothetical protein